MDNHQEENNHAGAQSRAGEAGANLIDVLERGFIPCPFCGGTVDWCDCNNCHQIQCNVCGMQLDNNILGLEADTIEQCREEMRKWWNKRSND